MTSKAADRIGPYLEESRELVLAELQAIIPRNRYRAVLYDLMLDYPLRSAKALRPALCIAICRALGGRLSDVTRSALALELFHNAFLVHDDVEDQSLLRRGEPTLHQRYGVPIAVNVGDAMLALALQPLLDNTETIGLGKALRVLQVAVRMARESAEGQALELDWIRRGVFELQDRDYWHMAYKKTCWYTFIAPILIGGLIAGAEDRTLRRLRRLAAYLGVAFQIQDDILNLSAEQDTYGKEINGDLWEGKHTLILMHAMRSASVEERGHAGAILRGSRGQRSEQDVGFLRELITRYQSLDYARDFAGRTTEKARRGLLGPELLLPPSVHRDFIYGLIEYVTQRIR